MRRCAFHWPAAWWWAGLAAGFLLLGGCGTPVSPASAPAVVASPASPTESAAARQGVVVGRHERLLVVLPAEGETPAELAKRFLGNADLAWRIAEANGQRWDLPPGEPAVVPLGPPAPFGVGSEGAQAVTVLCYHRFGSPASKMVVTPANFEAQLEWLQVHHYQVLRLADLAAFLEGRQALPRRSVLITIDDGYESAWRVAFPALKKRGLPATLFVPTDFVGARDAMSWAQMEEMVGSGLVDVQPHGKTHRSLADRGGSGSETAWRQQIEGELRQSRAAIERRLGASAAPRAFAYPFGDVDDAVLDSMQRLQFTLGLTVDAGGNPFYAPPLMLRRTMIFGDMDLDEFQARLANRRGAGRP